MNKPGTELARWLAGDDINPEFHSGEWLTEFDPDRQAVLIKLGPFKRLYLRPQNFTKHFYHQLFPLKVEHWPYRRELSLFDDFCRLELVLDLRFQATHEYAQKNWELLSSINQHIKHSYADLLEEIINRHLQGLDDGRWVHQGLSGLENAIVTAICEQLTVQFIQAQASCRITADFQDFPNLEPGRNAVFLQALKAAFEINEQKNHELQRQQRIREQHELEEKQRQLEHLRELADLESQAQALEAEKIHRLLTEQAEQLPIQLAIEQRIHAIQVEHDAQLKARSLESELQLHQQHQSRQRQVAIQELAEQLAHEAELNEIRKQMDIQDTAEGEAGDSDEQ